MPLKIFFSENADVFPGIMARNLAILEYERYVQRTFYPFAIHPYSLFWFNWQRAFVIFIFVRLSIMPASCVLHYYESPLYQLIFVFFHVMNLVDVIIKFFVGHVESMTEVAILDPKIIAKKYFLSYFLPDFLPCVPFELIVLFLRDEHSRAFNEHHWLEFANFVVVLRLIGFVSYCKNIAKLMLYNHYLMGLLYVIVTMYTVLVFAANFQRMLKVGIQGFPQLTQAEFNNNIRLYIRTFIDLVLECVFNVPLEPLSNPYIRGIILAASFFISLVFTVYFIKYVMLKMERREKILDMESRILNFMRKRQLPSALGYKTLLYCRILLENRFHREDEVFSYVPDIFKADIFFHLCLPLLKNFPPFEDLPIYVLRRIAEALNYELHLPNEVVMTAEDHSNAMYFVQRGTVAFYSSDHVELYHFEAGSSFNGNSFILREPDNNFAISIEVTELYRLEEEDFSEIMSAYPRLHKRIQERFRGEDRGKSEQYNQEFR